MGILLAPSSTGSPCSSISKNKPLAVTTIVKSAFEMATSLDPHFFRTDLRLLLAELSGNFFKIHGVFASFSNPSHPQLADEKDECRRLARRFNKWLGVFDLLKAGDLYEERHMMSKKRHLLKILNKLWDISSNCKQLVTLFRFVFAPS